MEAPARYRELAAECLRLVSIAKTEEHHKTLREMAQAWQELAEEPAATSESLRARDCSIGDVSCSSS